MSGYRTIHRQEIRSSTLTSTLTSTSPLTSEDTTNKTNNEYRREPIWSVHFSPCNQTHTQARNSNTTSSSPLRLLASSADGLIRAYSLTDKSSHSNNNNSNNNILDASALSMKLEQILVPTSDININNNDNNNNTNNNTNANTNLRMSLGSAAIFSIRNYVGEDVNAGGEVLAAIRLDGHISVWLRDEQPLYPSSTSSSPSSSNQNNNPAIVKPDQEFRIKNATGTTLLLLPPQITGYTKHGIIMMVGCLDGSVSFISTGIGMPDNRNGNDTSKSNDAGVVLDKMGSGSSCPLSLALQPNAYLTFAVGRKNGMIDIFSSHEHNSNNNSNSNNNRNNNNGNQRDNIFGKFRRCHRLNHHAGSPVRALSYTPDGSLLISACDNGHIYIHDVSSYQQNQSIRMVASILNAHKSYILSITTLPDAKRFMTCSADKKVKVWDVSIPNSGAVHTFDTGHDEMIWDLSCSDDGRKCVSCSDDGLIQVYSCE